MTTATRVPIVLLVVLAAGCAHVQRIFDGQPGGIATGTTAGIFIQEENDSIAPGNRDKFYTQGLRWGKTFNRNPQTVDRIASAVCNAVCRDFSFETVWTSGIAQTMFTPDDISIEAPQPYDRPWAGFIYLDNTLRLVDDSPDPKTQIVIELQTGTIGRKSGADWAQAALHSVIGADHPTWHDQLERPLGVELIYTWNRRFGNEHVDLLPFAGGAVGTTMLYANAGAQVRLGWNLSSFFNTAPMQGTLAVGGQGRPSFEGWVYAGGNATFIPYNYFLRAGDIEPKRRVRDLMAGASVRYRSYRLTYNLVRRSREFSHPLGPQFSAHDYGSFVLSYELVIPSSR